MVAVDYSLAKVEHINTLFRLRSGGPKGDLRLRVLT